MSNLATQGHVTASTQNQAWSPILFLYRPVLGIDPGGRWGVNSTTVYDVVARCRVPSPLDRP